VFGQGGYNCFQGANIPPTGCLHKPLGVMQDIRHQFQNNVVDLRQRLIDARCKAPWTMVGFRPVHVDEKHFEHLL